MPPAPAGGSTRLSAQQTRPPALNADSPQSKHDILQVILQYMRDEGFSASVMTIQDEARVRLPCRVCAFPAISSRGASWRLSELHACLRRVPFTRAATHAPPYAPPQAPPHAPALHAPATRARDTRAAICAVTSALPFEVEAPA